MQPLYSIFWLCLLFRLIGAQRYNEFAVEMNMDELEAGLDLEAYNIQVVRYVPKLGKVFHLRHTEHQEPCTNSRCKRKAGQTPEEIIKVLRNHPMISRVDKMHDLEVEQKFEYFIQDSEEDQLDESFEQNLDQFEDILDKEISQTNSSSEPSNNSSHKVIMKKKQNDNYRKDNEDYYKLVDDRRNRVSKVEFNDPEAENLWQYNNEGQFQDTNPGLDMNLYSVYLANITGRGVVATVVDDGLDTRHVEIASNFDPVASLDLNDPDNVMGNPRGPRYRKVIPLIEGHGTSCASLIAGIANNRFCGFGVAHNANIGGIRMLSRNMVTDLLEAYALTHNNEYIDIYSNSWGPKDTGKKTAPITYYVNKALRVGVEKGRQGKGSIFLFAAGNGGLNYDNCGADGLVNSPYTIAVTSTNIYGRKPAYTEECSAVSITAAVGGYSYGEIYQHRLIDPVLITAQVNNKCLKRFLGTSAATPLIAGCVALALEANPDLTWRDVQNLFAISSRIPNPWENVWQLNTAGIFVSHYYGMGLLDCGAFVRNAQLWLGSGPRLNCIGGKVTSANKLNIRSQRRTRITFDSSACSNSANLIVSLEQVMLHTKIEHGCRGDLAIVLTSPTGTKSYLLRSRKYDEANETISFSHLSLMNWGENPTGSWLLDIADVGVCGRKPANQITGSVLEAVLEFHGTGPSRNPSAINMKLYQNFLSDMNLIKPSQSRILDEQELYSVYNRQRQYFIKQFPLHKISDNLRRQYKKSETKNSATKKKFHESLQTIKDRIPNSDYNYLTNLFKD